MADGRSARADRRGRSADACGKRAAFRARRNMERRCARSRQTSRGRRQLRQRPRAALPALSRSSGDGDGVRRCAVVELENLLREGGKFTWAAGPLAKGSNLCHGTGGNGYAFLKLYRRTGDAMWLERARSFSMTDRSISRDT